MRAPYAGARRSPAAQEEFSFDGERRHTLRFINGAIDLVEKLGSADGLDEIGRAAIKTAIDAGKPWYDAIRAELFKRTLGSEPVNLLELLREKFPDATSEDSAHIWHAVARAINGEAPIAISENGVAQIDESAHV